MSTPWRAVGLVAAVGLVGWAAGDDRRPAAAPVGAVGCASSNCHGAATIRDGADAWRSSYTKWAADDPHRKAFASLDPDKNEIARRMQAAFRKREPNYKTTTDARCLACHVGPPLVGSPTLHADGVSCEACHGPAEKWQLEHTRRTHAECVALGMTELTDHRPRAKACAGCHVGAGGDHPRDMNHDMIAAGHPRLVFDFATHSKRLPPHWHERESPFSAAGWLAGLSATAEATCELTADRAARAAPWPELAEWNCYGCHHNLVPGGTGRGPGGNVKWELPWPLNTDRGLEAFAPTAASHVREIQARPADADAVRANAVKLRELFAAGRTPADAVALMRAAPVNSWDDGYRAYLGLYAVGRPAPTLKDMLGLPRHPVESMFKLDKARTAIADALK